MKKIKLLLTLIRSFSIDDSDGEDRDGDIRMYIKILLVMKKTPLTSMM